LWRRGASRDSLGGSSPTDSLDEASRFNATPHRSACVVSCRSEHRDEVVAIAKMLGHGVAVPSSSSSYKNDVWKAVYGANLERVGACDSWLVICGQDGQTDLSKTQQTVLEFLQLLLEHRSGQPLAYAGGRILSYLSLEEYRAERVRYVQALEEELSQLKQRDLDGDLPSWTPTFLRVHGCQYWKGFNGRYKLCDGPHHGRNFYIRDFPDSFGRRACIYFWDERDGDEHHGWWLGFEQNNGRVFAAYNKETASSIPPNANWSVRNWNGWMQEPTLRITPY